MSTSHSNYKRAVRHLKKEAERDGTPVTPYMRFQAAEGNLAAKQWCKAKGVTP